MRIFLIKENKKHYGKKIIKVDFNNFLFIAFCILFIAIFTTSSVLIYTSSSEYNQPIKYTICLDAGHGGIDGGATGKFSKESEINLEITKKLTELFIAGGFNVVNTRTEDKSLCDESSPRFKLDDMEKRREIIQNTNPNILISIHCNKFYLSSSIGAQVFYQNENEKSKILADTLTEYFIENLPNARKFPLSGDYYVLNSTSSPSVIVECGYISNIEEEILLNDDEYQNKLAYSIYAGTLKYLLSKT